MKKTVLLISFMIGLMVFGQRSITVSTPGLNCKVALISAREAAKAEGYGWWSVWHDKKTSGAAKATPYTFNRVYAGEYTLVVFWEDGEIGGSPESDGIAVENIKVEPYHTEIGFRFTKKNFKDWNCLSCPWLCVYNGDAYVKQEEVIKDVVGVKRKQTTLASIASESVIDGKLKIMIREEKDEVSHLDQIVLKAGDQIIYANESKAVLNTIDEEYLILKKGENVKLEFDVPAGAEGDLSIQVNGFYEPEPGFIEEVTARLLEK